MRRFCISDRRKKNKRKGGLGAAQENSIIKIVFGKRRSLRAVPFLRFAGHSGKKRGVSKKTHGLHFTVPYAFTLFLLILNCFVDYANCITSVSSSFNSSSDNDGT